MRARREAAYIHGGLVRPPEAGLGYRPPDRIPSHCIVIVAVRTIDSKGGQFRCGGGLVRAAQVEGSFKLVAELNRVVSSRTCHGVKSPVCLSGIRAVSGAYYRSGVELLSLVACPHLGVKARTILDPSVSGSKGRTSCCAV